MSYISNLWIVTTVQNNVWAEPKATLRPQKPLCKDNNKAVMTTGLMTPGLKTKNIVWN